MTQPQLFSGSLRPYPGVPAQADPATVSQILKNTQKRVDHRATNAQQNQKMLVPIGTREH